MRIVCPDCAATYEVPDTMLASGRQVRCARCGREWSPDPDARAEPGTASPWEGMGEPPLTASTQLATATLERLNAPPDADATSTPSAFGLAEPPLTAAAEDQAASRFGAASARYAWAASLLMLVFAAWAAYTWRDPIMRAWPPSERVYAALGLT